MKTNSLNFLLAFLMLFFASCQKESLSVQEEGALTGLSVNNLKAARVISAAEACTTCIDPENPVYYPETGDFSGAIGGNTKVIAYEVYNTLTSFVVKVNYTRPNSNSNSGSTISVTVGTQTQSVATTAQGGWKTLTFDLPAGWGSCDALPWSLVETTYDGALPIAGSGSYALHAACGCEESFTYVDNGDNTYTFTYIPEEDIEDAALVFTFAQGVAETATGLDGWDVAGSTRQTTMDLVACETYTWTVGLTADCSGNSATSNVWTDFKINGVSKKANVEDKFIQSCPQ